MYRLIRVENEDHIWADEFDGEWKDIYKIQDDIAFKVAEELKAVLSENEIKSIERQPTEHLEAYNFYLRGNDFYYRSYEEQDWSIAINMYQKAIELDSTFALAYTMLARSHLSLYWFHFDKSVERLNKSKKAIDAAFSIDPDLVDTYVALGAYYYWGFLDYSEALKQFETALVISQNNIEGIYLMACVHRRMGNLQKAEEGLLSAFHKDPGSSRIAYNIAETYYLMGEYTKALKYIDIAINLSADFTRTYRHKIDLYLKWEGNTKNARKTLEDASLMINPSSDPLFIEVMVALDIYEGNFQDAIDLLNTTNFEAVQPQFYYYPKSLLIAMVYDLLEDTEKAHHYYDLSRIQLETKVLDYPDDSRFYSALGICYAGLGMKDKALQYGEKAVELLPVTKEAYRGVYREGDLARIYVMVGEYELALEKLDYLLSIPDVLSAKLLQLDPVWKPLWNQPGFNQLIDKYSEK
ncbi:MAG: hypothetical protein ISS19_04650 [Bacteroidales bacterium]|nr:hypothetical protein [Bacteroidales bacterium]